MSETFTIKGQDWYNKTMSIEEGIDKINDEKRQRQDINCPLKHMRLGLNDDNQIVMEYLDGREFVPTEHALRQMASWMHVPHGFLKTYSNPVLNQNYSIKFERDKQDMEILLSTFKNGIRDGRVDPEKEFRFRTYSDGTLRAMLSDRYAIIDNTWYLETVRDNVKKLGYDEPRIMKWLGNADTIYGNMLFPDTVKAKPDSDYGSMLSLSNCEIGIRRLSLIPSIFRSICTNGMIFGREIGASYSRVHRGNIDLESVRTTLLSKLQEQLPKINIGLDKLMASQQLKLDNDIVLSNVIAQVVLDHSLTQGKNGHAVAIAQEFQKHEKENRNLFGIVNSITRAAQQYVNEDWVKMDEIGGRMAFMSDSQWDSFKARAKSMDTNTRDKVFGIVSA